MALLITLVLITVVLFALFLGGGLVAQGYLYQAPADRFPLRALSAAVLVGAFLTLWVWIDQGSPRKYDTLFSFEAYEAQAFDEFEAVRWVSPDGQRVKVDVNNAPVEVVAKFKRGEGARSNDFFEVGSDLPFQVRSTSGKSGDSFMTVAVRVKPDPAGEAVRFNAQLKDDPRMGKIYADGPDGRRFVEENGSRFIQADKEKNRIEGSMFVPNSGTVFAALLLNLLHLGTWFVAFWAILHFTRGHAFALTTLFGLVTMLLVMPVLFKEVSRAPKQPAAAAPKAAAVSVDSPRRAGGLVIRSDPA